MEEHKKTIGTVGSRKRILVMEKINKCKTCGKETKKNRIFCSKSCRNKDPDFIKRRTKTLLERLKDPEWCKNYYEKRKKNFLEKYGVDHQMKLPRTKEKLKQTNLKKYGVENPSKNPEILEKRKKTILEKYGVDHPLKSESVKEKIKKTNLERYGVDHHLKSKEIQEKQKKTNLEKYGAEYPSKSEKIREKIKKTNLEKYGAEYPSGSEKIREKIKKTNLEKYGAEYPYQKHIKNIDDWHNKFAEIYNKFNGNVNKLSEYFGVNHVSIWRKTVSCGLRDKYESSFELELKKLLDSVCVRYEQNKLKILDNEYQLDLYLPDHNIALECNGLYWHTELGGLKDKYYHLTKTIKCEEKGIHLIHIWEHLWNQKKEIYWSIIGSHLGMNEKIFARKCKIVKISDKIAKEFYDKNHIQGSTGSSVHIGLEYDDMIVSVMSFGKSRFNKNYEYEMTRYCCAIGKNVVGGASKIFDYFVNVFKPNSIVSYSDRSIFKGKMYEKIGFKFIGYSEPNYWYTRDYETCYSRIKFQKHKLSKILESFDPDLTEWENMKNNNWDRYWDCGNGVWSWKR